MAAALADNGQNKNYAYVIYDGEDITEDFGGGDFIPYNSNVTIDHNYMGHTPQDGDYVLLQYYDNAYFLTGLLSGNTLYIQSDPNEGRPVITLTLTDNVSLEDFLSE